MPELRAEGWNKNLVVQLLDCIVDTCPVFIETAQVSSRVAVLS